jgi:hypothetical protein
VAPTIYSEATRVDSSQISGILPHGSRRAHHGNLDL